MIIESACKGGCSKRLRQAEAAAAAAAAAAAVAAAAVAAAADNWQLGFLRGG